MGTGPDDQALGPLADDAVDALVRAGFATMSILTRIAAENDVSLTQLRVLGILRDRRLRITELAAYLGLEKSTLSGLIARAEQRGLVERTPSAADRRAVEVTLSPDGRRIAADVRADVARSLAPLTDRLTAPERRRLAALLERMLGDPGR